MEKTKKRILISESTHRTSPKQLAQALLNELLMDAQENGLKDIMEIASFKMGEPKQLKVQKFLDQIIIRYRKNLGFLI